MVAKRYDAGNETVVRVDPSGAASNDTWTGNQIDHYLGDHWTGSGPGVVLAAYSAAPVAEAAAQGTGPKGNPQHNGTTDPGMMLVAYQDCHKSNAENTLYARYPSYSLRLPTDKSSVPQQNFTVFEYIARLASKCHIQGYGSLNPCQYADGSLQFPYNVFEDEISTGIAGGSMDRTQYFLYGLPNQRLYGIKEIYRTLPGRVDAGKGWQ